MSDLILHNGKITTLDAGTPEAEAIAIRDGRVAAIGSDDDILRDAPGGAKRIDLEQRRVIPGLNDSHTHLIRGGLSFNMELRWEGVPSLADALAMLRKLVQQVMLFTKHGFSGWSVGHKAFILRPALCAWIDGHQ